MVSMINGKLILDADGSYCYQFVHCHYRVVDFFFASDSITELIRDLVMTRLDVAEQSYNLPYPISSLHFM